LERELAEQGVKLENADLQQMENLWEEAKKHE